ncbi:hypothetical protein C8Q79DRAFT_1007282 [Trametes meyenii]|nr:hypothetical protein C8Q79DRAFT_1007282 [Trametes meyenii]
MSFRSRRINRSKKVPGVKLRPADPSSLKDLRTPESTWAHSSGLDSDEETSRPDLCPRPFKGIVICATGINDKTSLFKLALELGAQTLNDLTDKVTHLVAEEAGSAKYRCALGNRIPIMHPSWVIESHKVWLRGDDVDVAESIEQYRLPPFAGVVLCVSGIEDVNRRMEINREVTQGGGTYVKQIERPVRVTHLLCANTSEGQSDKVRYADKFNRVGEAQIHIVWEDWFWDSLRFGGRFDEEAYKVSNPRPPPKVLPEGKHPVIRPPQSSSPAPDEAGISSEIENAQASAVAANPAPSLLPGAPAQNDIEELASSKRHPTAVVGLWQSILRPRGFALQNGHLVRSPSKSQSQPIIPAPRDPSPPRRRAALRAGDGDPHAPVSAISSFRRARSFAPPTALAASTPLSRQPFRRAPTVVAGEGSLGKKSSLSFLGRSVGSVQAAAGMSADAPIASTSAVAGPSRSASVVPGEVEEGVDEGECVSEGARELFKGMRIRALGEAKSVSVRKAIEDCGGTWIGARDDDDDDAVDFIIVRLVSGSAIYRNEGDEAAQGKYRTECWLERCIFEERVCAPTEHVAFVPLATPAPVPGTEDILLSYSGLDQSEACWVRRLLRALGIVHAPNFSRRTTHLLCPSGEGAKADKAREWGTPIIDMDWLAAVARTGQLPSAPSPSIAGNALVDRDGEVDLQVMEFAGEPEVLMATQHPPPSRSIGGDRKGKGKEKDMSRDESMVDITNEDRAPRMQSLSYGDPPPNARPHAAEELESFGLPAMLLGGPTPDKPPGTPHRLVKAPTPVFAPEDASAPSRTQPDANPNESSSIPPLSSQGRVPSSESPSPMRMPGERTPGTPVRVTKHATRVLQESISTLLGKRPASVVRAEREEADAEAVKGKDGRLGKRSRPLNRSRSNMSFTESVTPGRSTPVLSPHSAPRSRESTTPARPPAPSPQLAAPPAEAPLPQRRPSHGSGDEGDNSFLAEIAPEGSHVMYADPKARGVRERLKHLFGAQEGGRELWEAEADGEGAGVGMRMDVEEMTLPQLSDVGAAVSASARSGSGSGRRTGARGRGRRGRKSGR